MTEYQLRSHNKVLHGKLWNASPCKAVIIFCHGYGEHIGRYQFIAEKFGNKGFSFLGTDLCGHGKSEGKRGDISGYDEYLDNIEKTAEYAREQFPEIPLFLYGQSMGGSIAANYLIRKVHTFKGALITSPWFRLALKPPAFQLFMAKFLKSLGISISQKAPLDPDTLSRDKTVGENYINDPLVHDRITSRAFFEIVQAGEYAIQNSNEIDIPILVAHGSGDVITSVEASKEFISGCRLGEFKEWNGAFHETHFETNAEEVLDFNINWISRQL